MPGKKSTTARFGDGSLVLTKETYTKLTDLMDELAFRGPMQEALIVRIANCAEFTEVLTRIKRRRLYTKKMAAGTPAGDDGTGASASPRRKKKPGKKRPRPTGPASGGGQSEAGTKEG